MPTRLERSATNKVIAGVCGGIAEYLQVDPTLVRVFFVIATLATAGLGFLAYIVLVVLMPLPGQPTPFVKGASADPATGGNPDATTVVSRPATPPDPEAAERRRAAFGYFLVALGVVFLLANIGAFRIVRWDYIWPLVFIAGGAWLLAGRIRR
jgi:phage shock protein PspC (stress-responsive transcriptional regulator)